MLQEKILNAEESNWLGQGLKEQEIKQIKELATISAKIQLKRVELGMTQKEFAQKMGVSQGMVSKWESGEYNFTINTINDICERLGLLFEPLIKEKESFADNTFSVINDICIKNSKNLWINYQLIDCYNIKEGIA